MDRVNNDDRGPAFDGQMRVVIRYLEGRMGRFERFFVEVRLRLSGAYRALATYTIRSHLDRKGPESPLDQLRHGAKVDAHWQDILRDTANEDGLPYADGRSNAELAQDVDSQLHRELDAEFQEAREMGEEPALPPGDEFEEAESRLVGDYLLDQLSPDDARAVLKRLNADDHFRERWGDLAGSRRIDADIAAITAPGEWLLEQVFGPDPGDEV